MWKDRYQLLRSYLPPPNAYLKVDSTQSRAKKYRIPDIVRSYPSLKLLIKQSSFCSKHFRIGFLSLEIKRDCTIREGISLHFPLLFSSYLSLSENRED